MKNGSATERKLYSADVTVLDEIDVRLQAALRADYSRRRGALVDPIPRGVTVVLAGHRAAGKSHLLPHVAKLLGRDAIDLDDELARQTGRALRDWVRDDEPGFRVAERACFQALSPGLVVAVGGGFLSHHPSALSGCLVVLVPVSFETYVERLQGDVTRPRLRPSVSLDTELREVWGEREERHKAAKTVSLVDFVLRAERGSRPRRVVTLPPGENADTFAWKARHAGADVLEVRTDLTPRETELRPALRALPMLVSQRTPSVPPEWLSFATLIDRPLEGGERGPFLSFHAPEPMTTEQALAAWQGVPKGTSIKHIEPLGSLTSVPRLFETRAALQQRFGEQAVTVLPMGPLALPFRAVFARGNALDYLALNADWAAAPGQRLLRDAAREYQRPSNGPRQRLGILGHHLAHSRSPRIHRQPFDRIDLPPDTDLPALLAALHPHYAGFAVTNPFKKAAARAVQSPREAVNTLVRTAAGWSSANSDVEGARALLEALGTLEVTVLGDGGVGDALREAAGSAWNLTFVRRSEAGVVRGTVVWTWPADVEIPSTLRFENARVAVIAYGTPAKKIAGQIRSLGGIPWRLGPRWFIAQARLQRRLWESAT